MVTGFHLSNSNFLISSLTPTEFLPAVLKPLSTTPGIGQQRSLMTTLW